MKIIKGFNVQTISEPKDKELIESPKGLKRIRGFNFFVHGQSITIVSNEEECIHSTYAHKYT
jgi:hypothetical protein